MTSTKAAALSAAVLLLAAVVSGVAATATFAAVPVLVAGLLLGYLAADLLSGMVHWACDTFFAEDTPLIGAVVIWPFRDHHRHPTAITGYRLLQQDGTNYFILLPPLWMAARGDAPATMGAIGVHAALCGFAVGALGTNLFHKWAHCSNPARWVRWLQRCGVILSPDAHAVHHRAYTSGYCVTSGWLNAPLDAIGFFDRLQRCIRRVRAVVPRARWGG